MTKFDSSLLDDLAGALAKAGYLSTRAQIEQSVREIAAQMSAGKGRFDTEGKSNVSITKQIRGLIFEAKREVRSLSRIEGRIQECASGRDDDIAYAKKTLLTGTTPGSYLVPTFQADQVIQLLTSAHVVRQAGCRIWPMAGMQKLDVPVESASPTVVWGNSSGAGAGGQGVQLTPSDPGISQLSFDLRSAKALTAIPNELLAVSVPAIDNIVSEILGLAFAQAEMNAFVATTQGTGMPLPVYAASGVTTLLANGGNANGGAVTFSDLLGVLGEYFAQKGKGEPCWFMHPTVWYKDVLGLKDSNGRPIITGFDSLEGPFQGRLMGYKVFVSAEFPTNQAVGSGSNQSFILFTNPTYLHIADAGSLELAVSFERFFDSNETAIRGVHRLDHGFGPSQAIILLQGVNV